MKKSILNIATLATSLSFNTAIAAVDFYVVGHPDDWQLFMNPNTYKSIQEDTVKTIIIHTTSGDGGQGTDNTSNGPYPFYLAREEGAIRAARFLVNTDNVAGRGYLIDSTMATHNGHQVRRVEYGGTVLYFLRLPDGNLNGAGYASTGSMSLKKLKEGAPLITSIDDTASYQAWADLRNTLESIILNESANDTDISFNIADTNSSINPADHPDHIYTAKLLEEINNKHQCFDITYYTEYHSQNLPESDFGEQDPSEITNLKLIDAATWGVTTSGISDYFYNSSWESGHNRWLWKHQDRTINAPNCDFSNFDIASLSQVQTSSESTATEQLGVKLVDGVIDGYAGPSGDYKKEWASNNGGVGEYFLLNWPKTVTINQIRLYDRPNLTEHILSGTIQFSDGSTLNVGQLPNNGTALTLNLQNPKITSSLKFTITSVSSSSRNIGLSEVEVYGEY